MTTSNPRAYLTQVAQEAVLEPDSFLGNTATQKILRVLGEIALAGNEPIEIRAHALRMTLETVRNCAHSDVNGDAELQAVFGKDLTAIMFFRAALGYIETTRDARDFIRKYRD